MTREEIGSYLGLSLETVSRLFSRFHECGYIAIDQKHVLLRHVAGLRGLLQHRHIERSGGAPKRGAAGSFGAPIPRTANSPPRFLHQINPLNRS